MSRVPCRNESPAFDAKLTTRTMADSKPIAEIVQKHGAYPNQWVALSHFSCL